MPGMVGAGGSGAAPLIWSGVIEWMEKGKSPGDQEKTTKHLPCQVSATTRDIEPELKVHTWPNRLMMQLIPKQFIRNIGGQYLKDSKSVLFLLQPSEALDALTKAMVNGFAGCVRFASMPTPPQCDIKLMILLYAADKSAYLGFIPNNQAIFIARLKKVIKQQLSTQMAIKQQQLTAAGMPPNISSANVATLPDAGVMPMPGPGSSQAMVQMQEQDISDLLTLWDPFS